MRGEGNDCSDIDLAVAFPNLPKAWRESFDMEGFPVEAFVQDPPITTASGLLRHAAVHSDEVFWNRSRTGRRCWRC